MTRRLLAAFGLLLFIRFGFSHDIGLTGISVDATNSKASVTVKIPYFKLQQKLGGGRKLSNLDIDIEIRQRLKLKLDGADFVPKVSSLKIDHAEDFVTWHASQPEPVKGVYLAARLFPEDESSRTVVTFTKQDSPPKQGLVDSKHPSWETGLASQNIIALLAQFLKLGIAHILSGPDHILFVLGLILLGANLRSLLKTITAFTVAHSITLALAATRVFSPPPRLVEPLIALSIVAIAVENLRSRWTSTKSDTFDYRPYVAFSFGLVHGFGFADALTNLGVQGWTLAVALLGFNLGVEVGQASIIICSMPIIVSLSRWKPVPWRRFALTGSAAIGLVGGYWFVERVFAG